MSDSTTPKSGPNIGGQALLKRRPGTSTEDFRTHYITRHAPIAIPWCLSNGVTYYAQIHRPLRWTSQTTEAKHKPLNIDLEAWDAVAEMVFPAVETIEDYYRPKVGKQYHLQVILPDERRFLLDEALKHLQGVEPGAVSGERVEFIVGGVARVGVGGWWGVWGEVEGGSGDNGGVSK